MFSHTISYPWENMDRKLNWKGIRLSSGSWISFTCSIFFLTFLREGAESCKWGKDGKTTTVMPLKGLSADRRRWRAPSQRHSEGLFVKYSASACCEVSLKIIYLYCIQFLCVISVYPGLRGPLSLSCSRSQMFTPLFSAQILLGNPGLASLRLWIASLQKCSWICIICKI